MRGQLVIGAIGGDILGSRFERGNKTKSKLVELLHVDGHITDDTVMTVATMKWLIDGKKNPSNLSKEHLVKVMQDLGRKYLDVGYGKSFKKWLESENPQPYGSYANGSAMRISPIAYYPDKDCIVNLTIKNAGVSHNHSQAIRGALAVTRAMCLALRGWGKYEIVTSLTELFPEYDFKRRLENIRPDYKFDVSCQGSVPESIICFLEGDNYEDTVLNAISLGGDTDTMAAIAGGISDAYGKQDMCSTTRRFIISKIPADLLEIVTDFSKMFNDYNPSTSHE